MSRYVFACILFDQEKAALAERKRFPAANREKCRQPGRLQVEVCPGGAPRRLSLTGLAATPRACSRNKA